MATQGYSPQLMSVINRVAQEQSGSNAPQQGDTAVERVYPTSTGNMHIYSANGQPQPAAAFDQAMQQASQGADTPGFVMQPQGTFQQKLRSAYTQYITNPTQQAAQLAAQKAQEPPSTAQLMTGEGADLRPLSAWLSDMFAKQVATPEKGAATAGMAAGTAMTGGLGVIPAMGVTALTTIVGHLLGSAASGSPFDPGQSAMEGLLAAGGVGGARGVTGVIGWTLEKYFAPQTAQRIMRGMMDALERAHPEMRNTPGLFDAAMSAPTQLQKLAQMGSEGLMGDLRTVEDGLMTQINQVLPRNLTVGGQNTVRAQIRSILDTAGDVLDAHAAGDTQALTTARQTMASAVGNIRGAINKEFGSQSTIQNTLSKVNDVLANHDLALQRFQEGARVIQALKDSGAEGGFDLQRFIQTIAGSYMQRSGSLMEQMGQIAGQGVPLRMSPNAPPGAPDATAAANGLMSLLRMKFAGLRAIPNAALRAGANAPLGQSGPLAIRSFIEGNRE